MWFLQAADGSFRYLHGKHKFSVGRKNTDIVISNDHSISRTHAFLEIENNGIYVTDNGSKYGTYIGEQELQKSVKTAIDKDVQIKFGLLQSIFVLKHLGLTIATSNVKGSDKQTLCASLEFLGATHLATWSPSCSHLVVGELMLTSKVLCALIQEQPIVSVRFFCDLMSAVRNNAAPPDHALYLPQLNESLISKNIKIEYNSERKVLFQDKVFVFLTERAKNHIEEVICRAGGRVMAWEKTTLDSGKLKCDSPEYLFIEEPLEGVDQQSPMYRTFKNAVGLLAKQGKRSIPLQEIALAVVHNSCVQHCNPRFDRAALLVLGNTQPVETQNILAYDTQQGHATQSDSAEQSKQTDLDKEPDLRVCVPPSYDTDLETMMTSTGSSAKRTMDSQSTCSAAKRGADSQSACSAAKRIREDLPSTTGADFSFRRPSSQASSSAASSTSKTSMFSFPKTSKTASTVVVISGVTDRTEPEPLADNPFSRKRKASKDLAADGAKKSPLENISNTIVASRNTEEHTAREFLSSTRIAASSEYNFCKDVSCITKSTAWLQTSSTRLVERPVTEEPNDTQDYEVRKRNAEFKNSIVIEYMEVQVRRRALPPVTQPDGNKSLRNFKKFRKALIEIQTKILPESAMEKYVVGTESRCVDLDEQDGDNEESKAEEPEDDEFDRRPEPVAQKPTKNKRKYLFAS